jgi:hypothetical protein
MGHARANDLRDLRDALAEIRALPGVSERRPGVFWLRRTAFLHFHTTGDFRRAHAKIGTAWVRKSSCRSAPVGRHGPRS